MDMMIVDPSLQTAGPTEAEIPGKKFLPRAGAYLIDILALYGLNFVASYGMGFVLGIILYLVASVIHRDYYLVEFQSTIANYIIGIFNTIFYFGIFEWLFGRTVGKLLLGMRVIGANGEACTLKQAFTRSVYRLLDGLFFGIVAASYMKPPRYQRLGDQKASTLVVTSRAIAVEKRPAWWKFLLSLAIYLFTEGMILMAWTLLYVRFV